MKSNFRVLTVSPDELNVVSTKLGAAGATGYKDGDIGKPVKRSTAGNYVLCADGDAIDGFIDNIDAGGTQDGLTFGGVANPRIGVRFKVMVSGAAAVLDYVVAGANAAVATANTDGYGVVKKSATATQWQIVSYTSDAASGTDETAVIERVIPTKIAAA